MICKNCGPKSPDYGKFYARDGVHYCADHYQEKYAKDISDPKYYEAIPCRGCHANLKNEFNHYC